MDNNTDFLKKLSETTGVSGYEDKITSEVEEVFREYTDKIKYDNLGNLVALKQGTDNKDKLKVMLAAHMDEIGLMVNDIEDEGFLRFTSVGGVDQRTLVGQEVIVLGKEELTGIIGAKPPHVQDAKERKKAYEMDDKYNKIGEKAEKAKKKVHM